VHSSGTVLVRASSGPPPRAAREPAADLEGPQSVLPGSGAESWSSRAVGCRRLGGAEAKQSTAVVAQKRQTKEELVR
jgi:hypothetical protein